MTTVDMLVQILPFAFIIIVFYFILIRPQRKREKADEAMRNNLEVGDVVTTRGGIVGKVTNIKDDQITLQTGADSVKIRVMRWAIAAKEQKISD
ncbi:MAG: preprotein translocase subunit YajC [Ruminococcaceae bacterium]|nr:preprotein translocase subunit YajC [Oscillospiraceae bacterium]